MFWIGLIVGLFVGAFLGILGMGLCVAAGKADEAARVMRGEDDTY